MANKIKQQDQTNNGRSPLLIILILLNTICILGIGTLQYLMFQKQNEEFSLQDVVRVEMEEGREIDSVQGGVEEGIFFPLEKFTVNLAQGEGPGRYVRMVLVLELSLDSSEEEFQVRKPQIRDTIIGILNSKRPEDILKAEGKNHLKEEMKYSINSFLVDGEVKDIFYVSFQVN